MMKLENVEWFVKMKIVCGDEVERDEFAKYAQAQGYKVMTYENVVVVEGRARTLVAEDKKKFFKLIEDYETYQEVSKKLGGGK